MTSTPLFVSLFAYVWTKNGGSLFRELVAGEASPVPAFRTLHRLRRLYPETALYLDGSTLIARARCRAAGAFLASKCPLWLTLDEDVDADVEALEAMFRVAAELSPSALVFAAMRLAKDPSRLNIEAHKLSSARSDDVSDHLTHGGTFFAARAGSALALFPRQRIQDLTAAHADLDFEEHVEQLGRTVSCPGLFLETIERGAWQGEDVKFCDRARAAGVPMVALVHPGITHAGLSNRELLK